MQLNFMWDSLKECMLATKVLWRIFQVLRGRMTAMNSPSKIVILLK